MSDTIFKGPLSYGESEKNKFRGREKESKDLFYLVSNNDFSVCYAESGEGKSSLINAGLCPLLRENGMFPVLVRFGEDVFRKTSPDFDGCIWTIFINEVTDKAATLAKPTPDTSAKLWSLFQTNVLRLNSNETLTPVLIFDQFEEVFTRPADISWTKNFFKWLEDFCLHISSGKSEVKILLSLRSEYVCELDYWSMSQSQCFIPSLKNHRYYLKPLTKKSAYDVLGLGKGLVKGLEDEALLECAKAKRIEHLPEGKTDDDIPCISALLLSLMLSALEEEDEKVTKYIRENMGKRTYEDLLGYVYEKALNTSGVSEECQKILEDSLIDGFGNRKKVAANDLSAIPEEILKSLTDQRIINKVSGYYEISHDSICSVMNERRKDRVDKELKEAEEAKAVAEAQANQLRNQRQDIIASSLLVIYAIFAMWFLGKCFCDADFFGHFFPDNIVTSVLSGIAIANFLFVPVIICAVVKELRLASWLSGFWLIFLLLAGYLMKDGYYEEQLMIISLMSSGVAVSVITLYLSCRWSLFGVVKGNDFKTVITSLPFLLYLLILSIFLFCLCVFNQTFGVPQPAASFWGVFVIPFLTHAVLCIVCGRKNGVSGLLPLCLLLLLSSNTAYPLWGLLKTGVLGTDPFAFPFFIVFLFLLFITIYIIRFYKEMPLKKRLFAEGMEIVAIYATFIMNLGFWPIVVDYDRVTYVHNWLEIIVKDNNKYGIVSPKNDIVYPIVFDSISTGKDSYCYLSSNQFEYNESTEYSMRLICNSEGGFVTCKFLHSAGLSNELYKAQNVNLAGSISDSLRIQCFAAKTFLELLKANTLSLKSGNIYTTDSVPSLLKLYELQRKDFYSILSNWNTWKKASSFEDKVDKDEMVKFSKAFARTFYLCMMKELIQKGSVFDLVYLNQHLLFLYFYKSSSYGLWRLNYEVKDETGKVLYNTTMSSDSLKKENIDYWYRYVRILATNDKTINRTYYFHKLERILAITRELDLEIEGEKQLNQLLKVLTDEEKEGKYKATMKKFKDDLLASNKKEEDIYELVDTIYNVLPAIVENTYSVYNAELSDILGLMSASLASRLNQRTKKYYKDFLRIDSTKNANLLREFDHVDSMDSLIEKMNKYW